MISTLKLFCVACTAVSLAGCVQGETWDKLEEYGGSDGYWNAKSVTVGQVSYVVQEHDKRDRILIRWSNGDNLGNSIASNVTLGIANDPPDSKRNKDAAAKFISENQETYRGCSVKEAYLIQTPWYEVIFDCET